MFNTAGRGLAHSLAPPRKPSVSIFALPTKMNDAFIKRPYRCAHNIMRALAAPGSPHYKMHSLR